MSRRLFPVYRQNTVNTWLLAAGLAMNSRLSDSPSGLDSHDRKFWERLMEKIPVMITLYDPRVRIVRVNREFEHVLGWTTDDANRIDLVSACYPDPATSAEVKAFMGALEPGWRDFETRTKSGEIVPTSWCNIRLRDQTQVGIGIGIDLRTRRAADREYRTIVQTARDGFWLVDARSGRVLEVNEAYCAMSGYSRAELLQLTVPELEEPGAAADYSSLLERVARGHTTWFESHHRRKDGTSMDVEVSVQFSATRSDALIVFIKDVTATLRAMAALRESEAQLQRVLAGSMDGFWEWQIPSGHLDYSLRNAEMLGYAAAEIDREVNAWLALVHPDDLAGTRRLLDETMRGDAPQLASEARFRTKIGVWKWILIRGKVVRRTAAGAPELIAGTFTDIDDRKQAEEKIHVLNVELEQRVEQRTAELRAANAELTAREKLLRGVVNALPESFLIMDPSGLVLEANVAATERLLGGKGSIVGRSAFDLLPPEVARVRRARMDEAIASGRLVRFEDRRFGRVVDNYLTPLPDENGKVGLLVALGVDVTDHKRTEERLTLLNAAVCQAPNCVVIADAEGTTSGSIQRSPE
jgi:PAS domain S-box-containing protein